jgi:GTPase
MSLTPIFMINQAFIFQFLLINDNSMANSHSFKSMNDKVIALVGRPNVGKSTLFNRLSTEKKAIVHDQPGVTRDRKYSNAQIGPQEFIIIDTPGLEEAEEDRLEYKMMQQTLSAIAEADLVCLIVDGRDGITPIDKVFANLIRKNNDNYVLIVNKCEREIHLDQEYYKLGFKDIAQISAEHNIGMMGLYEIIVKNLPDTEESKDIEESENAIKIVIAGRPNAGKSTFVNALIKEQRLLTGPEAGITRESIEIKWQYKDANLVLIDTAGLRRKSVVSEKLEKLSTSDTINSIKFANIVLLMLDSTKALEQQDLVIANHVINEGRCLVLVVNKSDLIENKKKFKEELEYKLSTHLAHVKNIPVIFISATKAQNLNKVLDAAITLYEVWNKKIKTNKLNEWLIAASEQHPLPLKKNGRRIKLKYITQIKTRPPTFKLFSNDPSKISPAYNRYLINSLREAFDIPGVPIRLEFTKSKNPYASSPHQKR